MKKIIPIILIISILLCACGGNHAKTVPSMPRPTPEELAKDIMLHVGREPDTVQLVNESYDADALSDYVEVYYGLASEAWDGCAIYRAAAADDAFEVSVFRLTEQADGGSVYDCLEAYRLDRQGDFFGYNPEQEALVADAMVCVGEGFAAVLICPEPRLAGEAFYARLSGEAPEEDSITPAPSEPGNNLEKQDINTDSLPVYWLPYTDPEIDDMSLWDNSKLVAAVKAGSDEELDKQGKKLYKEVNKVLNKRVGDGMSELEKEKAIYTWLTSHCEYDFRHYEVPNSAPRESYQPYGAIVEGKAVCLGFATAFQLFMDVLDIECITVVGGAFNSAEDHAWNMVRIDGEWFCVDVTWDAGNDPEWYSYFNVSSDYMAVTGHQWDYAEYPIAGIIGE